MDDTLLCARKKEDIDEVLRRLVHDRGMALEVEDSVAGFLGVHIHHDKEKGLIELTQRGLITRIIEALGIEDLPPVKTPATEALGSDPEGEPAASMFNYASVVGMMWYIHTNTG